MTANCQVASAEDTNSDLGILYWPVGDQQPWLQGGAKDFHFHEPDVLENFLPLALAPDAGIVDQP